MYIGRFVVVAPEWAGYRVSSRSFPHRHIVDRDGTLTVAPTDAASPTDNPYVSYNCLRSTGNGRVIGNGSHVDPIAEKLELGYPPRDALAHGLLTLDFEKDDYDTPRIAGVLGAAPTIAIVRRDALLVEAVDEPTLVATYEHDAPRPIDIDADDAEDLARSLYDLDFEHPVCAAAVTASGEHAIYNGPEA